jgi:hypothetical protein
MKKKDAVTGVSREEAEALLREWADHLELDTKRELFEDLLDELLGVVERERLTFNPETEVFTYKLLKPVGEKTLITIEETTFKQKKNLQKYGKKEGMDAAALMVAKHTNLNTNEVQELKSRDSNKINAVIIGFLTQTALKGN